MNRQIRRVSVSVGLRAALTAVVIAGVWFVLEFLRGVFGLASGLTFSMLLFIAAVLGLLRIRDRVGGSSPPPTLGNLYTHCFDTGYRGRGIIRRFLAHWFGRDYGSSPPLAPPPAPSEPPRNSNARSFENGFMAGFSQARAKADLTIRQMAHARNRHDVNARKAGEAIRALELPSWLWLRTAPGRPPDARGGD